MLYRTQHQYHPFIFTFNTFSQSSSSLSPSPSLQAMDCLAFGNSEISSDDFFVDELLDFSNDFSETEEQKPEEKTEENEKIETCSVSQEDLLTALPEKSGFSPENDFGSLPESELSVPAEGLESLEWLSHFVEDSFSEYSLTGKLPPAEKNRVKPVVPAHEPPCFTTPVQTKARSKRARTGIRVWPVLSPESSSNSSSSSSSTSFTTASFSPGQPRRCSHCGVTKTPQWRAGPLGSKTLCNACGVRFKSGRLLPEYRPACSPTFLSEVHSNNHRKVLEMRRKKEVEPETTGLVHPVQSVQSF